MKKTTLITGSYGGLGKCLSLIHAEEGNNLILVGRSEEKLAEQANSIKEQYNIDVQTFAVNLALPEAAQRRFMTHARKTAGKWTISSTMPVLEDRETSPVNAPWSRICP